MAYMRMPWTKNLTFLICPSAVLSSGIILAAAYALIRRNQASVVVLATAATSLFACAYLPLGGIAFGRLEYRFPEYKDDGRPVAGIVMLDGSGDRFVYDLAIARRYPRAKTILSGYQGSGNTGFSAMLTGWLNPNMAILEGRSMNTYESAKLVLHSRGLSRARNGCW